MKIRVIKKSYDDVMDIKIPKPRKPKKVNIFWRTLLYLVSIPTLIKFHYELKKVDMERLGKNGNSTSCRNVVIGEFFRTERTC